MAQEKPTMTAIAKRAEGLPEKAIAKIDELTATLKDLSGRVNLVTPVSQVDSILEMHKVSLRAVLVNPTPDGGDCYQDRRFCDANERALSKNALLRIMGAAGAQLIATERTDDRSEPYYAEVEITLAVRDFDGMARQMKAKKEIDLREGAPETMKAEYVNRQKTGKTIPIDATALADKRRHILSLCETKALERALRAMFSLKQKYTVAELEKPFLVPKLVPALDPSDPDQKRALIGIAAGADMSLFGPAAVTGQAEPTPAALLGAGPESPPGDEIVNPPTEPREPVKGTLEEEPVPAGQVDPASFQAPPEIPPATVCTCPCGHEVELTTAVAAATIDRCGAPRCAACYPWNERFDFKAHPPAMDLHLPKRPGYTSKDAETWAMEQAQKRANK